MAMTPVPVKPAAPAPMGAPDIWQSFRTEMDRLFDRFAPGFGMTPFPSFRFESSFNALSPAVDIADDEKFFKLTAELPGMTEKDVQVSLSDNTLTIKGEKHQESSEAKQDYYLTERSYGEFRRSFILPEGVDDDKIGATFANGVLTVKIPKTTQAAPKKIAVKAAA